MKITKILAFISVCFVFSITSSYSLTFNQWKINFKKVALSEGISETTFDNIMKNAIFLPKVIEYDRYQPEFYEDTKTYISKRSSCLLYTSPSPRDKRQSRMPSSA